MNTEDLTNYFTYLDGLRESGVTNMWGASTYLEKKFHIGNALSLKVHGLWMESFGKHKSAYDRAVAALAAAKTDTPPPPQGDDK